MKEIAIIFIAVLLTACSNDVKISSDSKKFMGEMLGKTVSSNGELNYDEDRGCYLKTKNGAIAECLLKTKEVYKIFVNCSDIQSSPSIDGVKCGDFINNSHFERFEKICSESNFADGFYLNRNNAYIWVGRDMKVQMLALANTLQDIRGEGEEEYSKSVCEDLSKRELKKRDILEYISKNYWIDTEIGGDCNSLNPNELFLTYDLKRGEVLRTRSKIIQDGNGPIAAPTRNEYKYNFTSGVANEIFYSLKVYNDKLVELGIPKDAFAIEVTDSLLLIDKNRILRKRDMVQLEWNSMLEGKVKYELVKEKSILIRCYEN